VLYYDSETETFWSQMTGRGSVGPLTGKRLKWMPSEVTTWGQWLKKHPETTVLRPPFPLHRYEGTNKHYEKYRSTGRVWFPLGDTEVGKQYKPMDTVTIIDRGGKARCYPHAALKDGVTSDGDLRIEKNGIAVVVKDKSGKELPSMTGYWFAWCAFYPEGTLFEPK